MTCEEGEEGKLPSVDHGRRTDRGRDKKKPLRLHLLWCLMGTNIMFVMLKGPKMVK